MNEDVEARQLREEVELVGARTPARRYPDELRERLARWARGQQEAGLRAQQLEDAVGVPWESLSRWMKGSHASKSAAPVLRAVRVTQPKATKSLTLKTAHGYTVEGLDVAGLAELLARLG